MSSSYEAIAFTDHVVASQERYGSRRAQVRAHGSTDGSGTAHDPLGDEEREFITQQDGFYLATVSDSGWPYVQFRGGPRGFVSVPDDHTLAWADFRGNRQYVSTGNLDHDARVALIFLDYAEQMRLKVYGVATVTDVHDEGPYDGPLAVPGYRARVEREVRVDVAAYDWNCPQHITPRYTAEELAPVLEPMRRRVSDLEAENKRLRAELESRRSHRPADAPGPTHDGGS